MRARSLCAAGTAALLLLGSCGSSGKPSSSGNDTTTTAAAKVRSHVTIDAREFSYTLPAQIPAGWVDITLHISGTVDHQIAFAKLNAISFAAFETAAATTNLETLGGVDFVGGPNNVDPGKSVTATVHLEAGAYGVACFIPDGPDGKTYAEHGIVGEVEVVKTTESVDDAPRVDAGTVSLGDFSFLLDASFTGGGTVEIKNTGTQVHELIIEKEATGATLADVKKFLLVLPGNPAPSGPLPRGGRRGRPRSGPNDPPDDGAHAR